MMKFLAYLICYLIYPFSFLFFRRRDKVAFGSYRMTFNDNAKALFIYVQKQCPELDSAWVSMSKATVKTIREKGLKAYSLFSPKGLFHALTSKYWFYNSYSSDILFCLSGGGVLVNLWHGLPLKRIEFGIESGPLADRFVKKTWKERYFHPETFQRPDYVLSSTKTVSEVFAHAFRVPLERCVEAGYPRNEVLGLQRGQLVDYVKQYESKESQALVERLVNGRYSKVLVYMPTWRDSQRDLFVQSFDLARMDAIMREKNALLLLKPHANVKVDPESFQRFPNLCFVDPGIDMYPILPFTDVLITDYSSVMYDYLLMDDKDIILYLYDYEQYGRDRDFSFPFESHVAGRWAMDFDALCDCLERDDYKMDPKERERVVELFWGETSTGSPGRRLLSFLFQ